jgi:hypothetical protein
MCCTSLVWLACDRCPFRLLAQRPVSAFVQCCGASAVHDVSVPDGADRQIDVSNTLFPTEDGRVDLWLTSTDCAQLFDGAYPGGTAKCCTLVGPVALGQVSERIKVSGGTFRVFVQGYSSNTGVTNYRGDVGIWGMDCKPLNPVGAGN